MSQDSSQVSTDAKLRFLSSGAAFGGVTPVEVEETHMAWVFLTADFVFKLKKPVKYPFLDFSTIEAREYACREELRLNRRLADGIYLDVLPLTQAPTGTLAVGGDGAVVDWLVKMRRLPARRMLDALIARDAVSPSDIDTVAKRLGRFYQEAARARLNPDEYLRMFVQEHATNREVLLRVDHHLPRPELETAFTAIERMLSDHRPALEARAAQNRIVDGHGDLKPEHVCLLDPPVVIDCLEFNTRLRMVDPFDELCYLGIECERLRASWIGKQLIDNLSTRLNDYPPPEVLAFYRIYRCTLRARLSVAHLLEPTVRTPEKWIPGARQYLAIAGRVAKDIP